MTEITHTIKDEKTLRDMLTLQYLGSVIGTIEAIMDLSGKGVGNMDDAFSDFLFEVLEEARKDFIKRLSENTELAVDFIVFKSKMFPETASRLIEEYLKDMPIQDGGVN